MVGLNIKYKQQFVNDLCELIKIPSRSCPTGGEEGKIQNIMSKKMESAGARVSSFEASDVPEFFSHPLCHGPNRDYKGRPTIIGEIGPSQGKTMLIMAHSDTVPIFQPKEWTVDPFCGDIVEGKIYGLGSADDKWGLATMLTMIRAFKELDFKLSKRLLFISTIDEEHGIGNGLLLLMLREVIGEAALYLDGGLMDICIGNLGGSNIILRPKKTIEKEKLEVNFLQLKKYCSETSKKRKELFEKYKYFKNNWFNNSSLVVYKRTDMEGNFLMLSFYTLPGENREEISRMLKDGIRKSLGKDMELYKLGFREPWFEPALISETTPLISYMVNSVEEVLQGPANVNTISKQDAFVFNNHAKIPTVSFGIGARSGRGAFHQPDECVGIEDAWKGCRIVFRAISNWLAG